MLKRSFTDKKQLSNKQLVTPKINGKVCDRSQFNAYPHLPGLCFNPSKAETTLVQSTRTQIFLKTI